MLELLSKKDVQTIRILQDFNVSTERVFSFFSDHNRLSEIYPAFIHRIIDAPNPFNCNDVGSSRIIIGFPVVLQETITAYIENKYIEYKISSVSPLKTHIGKMNFIPLSENQSRLEYVIEFEPLVPFTGFLLLQLNTKIVQDALGVLVRRFKENPNY
ncbi:MAG TPA: SRPBCC family protein [Chitinophagales bacterium]|nr:SRPBCC family protein [Chitinophagales bacterium]HNM66482.1 SRPBCC family protein [Chitinophagales bacterium]